QPILVAQAEGSVAGMIQYSAEGDDGFGYDPVFYLPSYQKTMAQLPLDVKNKISHRANAAQKVLETLKKLPADR
ncbi:MAG: non-canonical purine NTP pyrophosphatase, partial [Chloroflexi bacterium]|nr:non-canonical purine NTP pyrophosphatase [Chloroflexota bacterium]